MSNPEFLILPYEILEDDRLTLRHIRVLMAIFSWRKKNTGLARVSRQMLSDRTGYPCSRVSEVTSELERMGWIEKVGNGGMSLSALAEKLGLARSAATRWRNGGGMSRGVLLDASEVLGVSSRWLETGEAE